MTSFSTKVSLINLTVNILLILYMFEEPWGISCSMHQSCNENSSKILEKGYVKGVGCLILDPWVSSYFRGRHKAIWHDIVILLSSGWAAWYCIQASCSWWMILVPNPVSWFSYCCSFYETYCINKRKMIEYDIFFTMRIKFVTNMYELIY